MSRLRVRLNVYDLSMGISRQFSELLAGKHFEAVYHTGVVVGDREYYYGQGVDCSPEGATPYGVPMERLEMGETTKTPAEIQAFLDAQRGEFSTERYNVITHNCNHFSNAFLTFLVGQQVPDRIVNQGMEFLQTPLGQMVAPMLQPGVGGMEGAGALGGMGSQLSFSAPSVAPSGAAPGGSGPAEPPPKAKEPANSSPAGEQYAGISLEVPKPYRNEQSVLLDEATDLGSPLTEVYGLSEAMVTVDSLASLVDAVCEKRDYSLPVQNIRALDTLLHAKLDDCPSPRPEDAPIVLACLDLLACACLTSSVVNIPVSVQPYYCMLNYTIMPSEKCKAALFRYANNWVIQIPGMRDVRQRADVYMRWVEVGLLEVDREARLMACRLLYNISRVLTAEEVEKEYELLESITCPTILQAAAAADPERKSLAAPANLLCGALGRCLLTAGDSSPAFLKAQRRLREADLSRLEGPCARDLRAFLRLAEAAPRDDDLF